MVRYIILRVAHAALVLLGISLIVFIAVHASGDPVVMMMPADAGLAEIEEFRRILGLDSPLHVQYIRFLQRAVQGDFGRSLRWGVPCLPLVLRRLPATAELAFGALLVSLLVAIPLGVVAAIKQGSGFDDMVIAVSTLGITMPTFWVGIMAILLFAVRLRLLPPSGRGELSNCVLPVLTLSLGHIAVLTRFTRSVMIDVLAKPYIVTARAKGLPNRIVLGIHAFRNALLPIITLVGVEIGSLMGGAVVTENVFAWPGIGRLVVLAVYNRDFPVVQACVMTTAAIFTLLNMIVDISYQYINPLVRY